MAKKPRQMITKFGQKLPKFCECGGKMVYDYSFGRVWSVCDTCSPVQRIDLSKLKARGKC